MEEFLSVDFLKKLRLPLREDGKNMNTKALLVRPEKGMMNALLSTEGKAIHVIKWQKICLNCVFLLGEM